LALVDNTAEFLLIFPISYTILVSPDYALGSTKPPHVGCGT